MKKLIFFILALTLLLSLSIPAMAAEDNTITIYFNNTANWSTVYVYAWNEEGYALLPGTYLGTPMTSESGNIYSIEVPTNANGIRFNDGNVTATKDLTFPTDGNNLFTYNAAAENSGQWSTYVENPIPNDGPEGDSGNINNAGSDTDAEVSGKYVASADAEVEYSVDITWSNLSFTYTAGDKSWDATDHVVKEEDGTWGDQTGTITVTNHSNAAIVAKPVWYADEGFSSAIMTFDCGETGLSIASASGTNNAVVGTIKVTPTGSLPVGTDGRIGKITITISGQGNN